MLTSAGEQLHLSARAFHRVLRVARTIADLESERAVCHARIAEALGYRPRVTSAGVGGAVADGLVTAPSRG